MTTNELFDTICLNLREKNMMPDDILDYSLADDMDSEEINTYEIQIRNNLDYGDNEGIYLDLWLEMYHNNKGHHIVRLGTFKTLDTSDSAMQTMAKLLADFLIETNKYVNSHLDEFDKN